MALVLADRIRETSTTTGTGTITLAGAVTGYRSFATVGNGNTTYYTISNPNTSEWEVGIGTYTSTGTTLSRTTVLSSSNAGSLVTFSAGSKDVFVTYPAGKSIYQDAGGGVFIPAPTSGTALNVTGNTAGNAVIRSVAGATNSPNYAVVDSIGSTTGYLTQGEALGLAGAARVDLSLYSPAGKIFFLSSTSFTFRIGSTSSSSEKLAISTAGNVTINAPTSGTPLTITGNSTASVASFTVGANQTYVGHNTPFITGFNIASDLALAVGSSAAQTYLYSGGSQRVIVATAGNVTINAPTSGNALTITNFGGAASGLVITGVASQTGANISTSTPSGTTNYWRLNQPGVINWDLQNIATTGQFRITNGAQIPFEASSAGNVTINSPSICRALIIAGDTNLTSGGLQFGATQQNVVYKGGSDFFIARNYSQEYTVWQVWAPPSTNVLTDNREATLALVREDASGNAEFIDVYNNGYPTGSPVSVQHGIRIQKRGTGQYRPFVIDQYDGTTYSSILNISTARNWVVGSPSSGTTITASGASGQAVYTANVSGNGISLYTSNGTATGVAGYYSGNTTFFGSTSVHDMGLLTANTARLTVNSSGNVQINTPTSGTSLYVQQGSTDKGIRIDNGSGSMYLQASGGNSILATDGAWGLDLGTNSTARLSFNASTAAATFLVGAATASSAVTFSATAMTVDCSKSNVFTTTFTANVTTAPTISNPQDGQTVNWFITQDATGSRTMTWPTSFKWPGGSAGVLSTAANSVDLLVITYRSTTGFWYASLTKGFA